jgi:transposase-like protein
MSVDRPVALRIPELCPYCQAYARVKLETTVKGDAVILRWCCAACNRDWPVLNGDELRLPRTG